MSNRRLAEQIGIDDVVLLGLATYKLSRLAVREQTSSPWIAGALAGAYAVSPRAVRIVSGLFAATAISDLLHRAHTMIETARQRAEVDLLTRRAIAEEIDEQGAVLHS
jgi:hypothetical protein